MTPADDRAHLPDPHVLVVDDLDANVELVASILRRAGMARCTTVTHAPDALARFVDARPDLVMLDLHMPHLDGFAVLEQIRAVVPDDEFLPVLVLTADATSDVRDRALAAGANDFLTKPFDASEVLLRTQNLLATRALHLALQRHNRALEAEVRMRAEEEARRAEDFSRRRHGIEELLEGNDLRMVFQPIVDLASREIVGVEALSRIGDGGRPPNEWFAEAWDVGLGVELELVAIRAALAAFEGLPPGVYLSVNASPQTLVAAALGDELEGAPFDRIVVEVTEHAAVGDYDALSSALDLLRGRGVRLAVDDAGAGFSSLQHILRLRPDVIKLDIDLTRGVDTDPVRRALAACLVTFAEDIGASITAEGIETNAELRALGALGVRCGQGYALARPGPLPTLDWPGASRTCAPLPPRRTRR